MSKWARFEAQGMVCFGEVKTDANGTTLHQHEGDLFGEHRPNGRQFPLESVKLLAPCCPTKMPGLWNNFHERAKVENLQRPEHPLYFLKTNSCFAGPGAHIPRPAGYAGQVVFEGELGVVIGKTCAGVSVEDAKNYIFGYTCVNDVTARDIMRRDPAFVQWTRAKGFENFGVFGPWIETDIDPQQLRVKVELAGVEKQNYPVSDMFCSPYEIVSLLSQDMTLNAGDVIACGTSVGACAMRDGDQVDVIIEGVGILSNRFG